MILEKDKKDKNVMISIIKMMKIYKKCRYVDGNKMLIFSKQFISNYDLYSIIKDHHFLIKLAFNYASTIVINLYLPPASFKNLF